MKKETCRICGCTDDTPCKDGRNTYGGCRWVEPSLCNKCARKLFKVTVTSYNKKGQKIEKIFRGDMGAAKDYLEHIAPSPF